MWLMKPYASVIVYSIRQYCVCKCVFFLFIFFMPMFWDSRVSTNLVDNYEIHVDSRN